MTHTEPAQEESEERFHVQYDSRDVKLLTLDEIQEAFEAGEIHENTFLCREGENEWLTLSVVAGLEDEEEEQAPVAETRPPVPARRPDVIEARPPMPAPRADMVESRPPMPSRRPDMVESRPPMPQRAPELVESRPPMPERRPEMNTLPATRAQSPYPSVVPVAINARSVPLSYGPVTSNISQDLDLDELALRPKRRTGRVLAFAAALTLVGGGAAFALGGGMRYLAFVMPSAAAMHAAEAKSQASLTLANVEPAPAAPTPAAAPAAADPVAAAAPSTPSSAPSTSSDTPAATPQFNDEMKQALLAQDKARATKHDLKRKARSAPVSVQHRGHAASSSPGFKSGGSAYDPLNGKL